MDVQTKTVLRVSISFVVLAGFLCTWTWICVQTWLYVPVEAEPRLPVPGEVASLAGLLSTTVAAGTAAVLGFTLPDSKDMVFTNSFASRMYKLFTESRLLTIGCVAYLGVGVLVAVTYLFNIDKSPEALAVYHLAAIGWAVAAFSSTFREPAK